MNSQTLQQKPENTAILTLKEPFQNVSLLKTLQQIQFQREELLASASENTVYNQHACYLNFAKTC